MEKEKGLCITCEHETNCVFSKNFPIWQCEEFIEANFKPAKKKKMKKMRQKKSKFDEEPVVLE